MSVSSFSFQGLGTHSSFCLEYFVPPSLFCSFLSSRMNVTTLGQVLLLPLETRSRNGPFLSEHLAVYVYSWCDGQGQRQCPPPTLSHFSECLWAVPRFLSALGLCQVLDTCHWFSMSQSQYGCSDNGPWRGPGQDSSGMCDFCLLGSE